MILSEKIRIVPTNLRMSIVAVAVCVFPLGIVGAQDFEAVERRLGGAVEAGEVTLVQANVMLEALRRAAGPAREMAAKKRHYSEFTREIKAAVKNGKVTKQEAEKRLTDMRREMFEGYSGHESDRHMEVKKRRYHEFEREIKAAVESGKVSEEAAKKRLLEMRREMFGEHGELEDGAHTEVMKHRYRMFVDQVKAALKTGKLTEEEAEQKLITLRSDMAGKHSAHVDLSGVEAKKRHYKILVDQVEAALEAGKLSEEQAEKKLIEVRRMIFEHDEQANRKSSEKKNGAKEAK